MATAIGDFDCDRAPVQATEFESEPVTIGKQIEDLWLERGGGGNNFEGYLDTSSKRSSPNCKVPKDMRRQTRVVLGVAFYTTDALF